MKEQDRKGFIVIIKDKAPKGKASKLIEEILDNKYVKQIEGKIEMTLENVKVKKRKTLKGGKRK